jgi:RsiW-degrading membrane proteinase PrsW (M82 family)
VGAKNEVSDVVGLIEEFAKILGVLVIARHRRHDAELDGLILGAAAGMGFASMESSGYAFVAFLRSGGNLSLMVAVTLLRGILSPVGHGTWTAILASVLFRESAAGRFRINGTQSYLQDYFNEYKGGEYAIQWEKRTRGEFTG